MKSIKQKIFLLFLLLGSYTFGQTPSTDPHWILEKEWDFREMPHDTLTEYWNINPCAKKLIHGVFPTSHTEPQSYSPDNVSTSTSGLSLSVKEETVYEKTTCWRPNDYIMNDNQPNLRYSYYTSGWVETKDSLKYGYIEGRMKIPYGYDFFPAFWTFKMSSVAVNGAEIDIFEMLPSEDDEVIYYPNNYNIQKTNVHLIYGDGAITRNENILIADYQNYHTYGMEWTPYEIKWYFDDRLIRTLVNPGVHDYTKTILNLALTPYGLHPDETIYPSSMVIDYVKWYSWNANCDEIIDDCSFWFGGYDNTVKKSITIGSGGCGNVQPIETSLILRAKEEIIIYGEFKVPLGSELLLDADSKNCY